MTCIGVCTQMAATVPTTTIMNAAADTSACTPAPLRIGAQDDGHRREQQTHDAQDIHGSIFLSCATRSSCDFSRSSACPCSWHTRDSVTFSTAPISLRFSSCS